MTGEKVHRETKESLSLWAEALSGGQEVCPSSWGNEEPMLGLKDAARPDLCFQCDLCRLGQDKRRGGYCNGLGRGAGRREEEDRSQRRRISALGGLPWGMEERVAAEVPRFSLGQQEGGSHLLSWRIWRGCLGVRKRGPGWGQEQEGGWPGVTQRAQERAPGQGMGGPGPSHLSGPCPLGKFQESADFVQPRVSAGPQGAQQTGTE